MALFGFVTLITHHTYHTAEELEKKGCRVLRSKGNEKMNSLQGLRIGGETLVTEIKNVINKDANKNLQRISFVGNSLGGLYVRYAIHLLYDESTGRIAGLQPHRLLTIATPHLGVKGFTFIDELGFSVPTALLKTVSFLFFKTGQDIFGTDELNNNQNSLLYTMATNDKFLTPMKSFIKRRLYANLNRDFVVPLGTAAFLDSPTVDSFRSQYKNNFGIVKTLQTSSVSIKDYSAVKNSKLKDVTTKLDSLLSDMRVGLDSVGWEKVVVNFAGVLPIAHNKICALTRSPNWLYNDVLKFGEGQFVMVDAANWLVEE